MAGVVDRIPLPLSHGAIGPPVIGGDITERLPMPLSGRVSGAAGSFTRSGLAYDFAIGGIPLLSYISDQTPYIRGLAAIRKSQFDNQQIPGEQSLVGWWLRSESTFIGGQGLLFQDPTQSRFGNEYGIRYGSGYGVNPWVDGKLTLLKSVSQARSSASGNVFVRGYRASSTDYCWASNLATLTRIDSLSVATNVVWGGAATILSLTSSGSKYYAVDTAGVWRGTDAGAGTKLWNNDITYTRSTLGYSKQRLMAAFNNSVYELGADPTAPPVNLSTLTANYTHPNANYTWIGFADGTDSIFAGGHDDHQGHIYKFELDTTGTLPVLTGGILAASLPDGETLLSMFSYLGTFVGLGTSRGFRVAQIDSNGDLQYGPLIFEVTGGVTSITGYDRFMWCGVGSAVNGSSGLYRVDLGQPLQVEGGNPSVRYAYATDLNSHTTGAVTSVSTIGTSGRRVFGIAAKGTYFEDTSNLESTGVLTTGKIRFNTLENKLYKFMSVRTPFTFNGTINVATTDTTGNSETIVGYNSTSPGANDVAISFPSGPQEYISLGFELKRSATNATQGPELNGWQIKAVPGVIRQRVFNVTFLMFDHETDKTGQKFGRAGRVASRLRDFEEMIQTGDAVQFQDLVLKTSDSVFVEDMEFRQVSSPGKGYASGQYGGYLTLKMRTVNDNINVVTT